MSNSFEDQKNLDDVTTIVSFATLYKQCNMTIQPEYQSQSNISPTLISNSINRLINQINNNSNKCKQIIQIPNLLHSLTSITNYNHNIHINKKEDQQSLIIRESSKNFLWWIHKKGDEQDQTELINIGYGRALTLSLCTAGGAELQGDFEIKDGLSYISIFLNELYNGRNNYDDQPSFPAKSTLSKSFIEQIEDEGGIEEVESQLTNKGKNFNIKIQAIKVKGRILNFFIDWSNSIPFWYW